ncbi:MAG TPA: MlaE family lipid ABC transporter permease subunit [Steroidobacteraceae bacterium]|nr:MlaE family lipid ABC transporter permease subunit [Steroidobacteraceae bacterium]
MYLTARRSAGSLELDLIGPWRISHFADINRELSQTEVAGADEIVISTERLEALDLSSSWILREFLSHARECGAQIRFRGPPPDQLRLVDSQLGAPAPPTPPAEPSEVRLEEPVEALGRHVVRSWQDLNAGLAFVGRLTVTALRVVGAGRMRLTAVTRHVYETGVTAIPIVALIAFLISVVIAYMSAEQLQKFGADIFVVDLVTIGVLRELGVLLTAIILAGRSGSAFAAEIGAMCLNEEIDALNAMGVDPFETLVLPRLAGLTIALPLLTVIADAIGLAGGALLCRFLLGIPLPQYIARVNDAIAPTTFWVGVIKAPVFALLIGLAGTYRGLQVQGSSRELGRLTTVAVVQSIFLVILADALFAVFFMELDI